MDTTKRVLCLTGKGIVSVNQFVWNRRKNMMLLFNFTSEDDSSLVIISSPSWFPPTSDHSVKLPPFMRRHGASTSTSAASWEIEPAAIFYFFAAWT